MATEIVDFHWIFPLKIVIFHSYVKLPEGILIILGRLTPSSGQSHMLGWSWNLETWWQVPIPLRNCGDKSTCLAPCLVLWFNWAQTCTGSLQPTVTLWPNIIRGPSSSQTASERHASLWGHKGALKVSASTGFTLTDLVIVKSVLRYSDSLIWICRLQIVQSNSMVSRFLINKHWHFWQGHEIKLEKTWIPCNPDVLSCFVPSIWKTWPSQVRHKKNINRPSPNSYQGHPGSSRVSWIQSHPPFSTMGNLGWELRNTHVPKIPKLGFKNLDSLFIFSKTSRFSVKK